MTQVQQQGAVGNGAHIVSYILRAGQPSAAAHGPSRPCPIGHPRQTGTAGRCALLQKELVGERMSQTITVWEDSLGSLVK